MVKTRKNYKDLCLPFQQQTTQRKKKFKKKEPSKPAPECITKFLTPLSPKPNNNLHSSIHELPVTTSQNAKEIQIFQAPQKSPSDNLPNYSESEAFFPEGEAAFSPLHLEKRTDLLKEDHQQDPDLDLEHTSPPREGDAPPWESVSNFIAQASFSYNVLGEQTLLIAKTFQYLTQTLTDIKLSLNLLTTSLTQLTSREGKSPCKTCKETHNISCAPKRRCSVPIDDIAGPETLPPRTSMPIVKKSQNNINLKEMPLPASADGKLLLLTSPQATIPHIPPPSIENRRAEEEICDLLSKTVSKPTAQTKYHQYTPYVLLKDQLVFTNFPSPARRLTEEQKKTHFLQTLVRFGISFLSPNEIINVEYVSFPTLGFGLKVAFENEFFVRLLLKYKTRLAHARILVHRHFGTLSLKPLLGDSPIGSKFTDRITCSTSSKDMPLILLDNEPSISVPKAKSDNYGWPPLIQQTDIRRDTKDSDALLYLTSHTDASFSQHTIDHNLKEDQSKLSEEEATLISSFFLLPKDGQLFIKDRLLMLLKILAHDLPKVEDVKVSNSTLVDLSPDIPSSPPVMAQLTDTDDPLRAANLKAISLLHTEKLC